MKKSEHSNIEEENEFEIGSLDPVHFEYVQSSIRELGKHLGELSRQENVE